MTVGPALTYLAAPYNHGDPAVVAARYRAINATAAKLLRLGRPVFSPITHNRPLLDTGLVPAGWEFWQPLDELILSRCDTLAILMLPGWEMSAGVRGEKARADKMGLPVIHIHPLGVGLEEIAALFVGEHAIRTLPRLGETLPCERHCSVCEGADHHWRFAADADAHPQFAEQGYMGCSHCPAIRQVEDGDE